MIFNQAYYTAMDRGYYMPLQEGQGLPGESPDAIPEIGVSPKDIGVSAHPAQDQLQQVKARIFQGASKVELGFFGRGKGSFQGGNTTPEMYGKEERIDIRELAKVNKVKLTTHATTGAGSLAGMGQQGFDEHVREQALHEIERAVDFAADVTRGGAVVIHANEFPRPIRDYYGREEDKYKFEAYPEEEARAVRHLVDRRSGQMIPVRRNEIFYEPVYKDFPGDPTAWEGLRGQKIPKTTRDTNLLFDRVPEVEYDDKGVPKFKTHKVEWKEIEQRAEALKQTDPTASPEKLFYQIQLENQIAQSRGASLFYGLRYKEMEKDRDRLREAFEFYQKLDETLPPEEKWKLRQQYPFGRPGAPFVPPEVLNPVNYLKDALEQAENQLRQVHQSSASADVQAEQTRETLRNLEPIKNYALGKTADTVARAAIYAWDKEKHLRQDVTKGEKMEKPLFVAVENYFPEVYGGHPDEIKEIVTTARKAMVDEIMKNGEKFGVHDKAEAEKLAKEHIKATWDTGHAFIWKKYFKGSDEEFKSWYLQKAKEWKEQGIMGHVHVSDNFGWDDEHVIPGQGIAPIKEFVSLIRDKVDKGEIDLIVEPAHQDYRALLGGWRLFGSSIYGTAFGRRDSWVDLERSYFGRTAPPYFLYGETAPDPESWTLWSGQRLE
ncbi:sugar phosphate isomerase/epimerase [Candidatus Woesearchaeota archaeon]|nr:sugar phosphate isomerase/epimerase [Candidatus Woesearchaeota archaeon]